MFTGIVSRTGVVLDRHTSNIAIDYSGPTTELKVGDSIAVNGACLTVVDLDATSFRAQVVPETDARTNLGKLGKGDPVNLELPLALDQRLDGHLVQGHVDTTVHVVAVEEAAEGREVTFELPSELAPYVAEKGSIALDGTSLTVARVDDAAGTFAIALIPHTLRHTIAGQYVPGTLVNVEVDIVARYMQRLLRRGPAGVGTR
jgi:riboflavin synthase